MVWFKVDDKAHANTKIRNVLATCPAALSLWTVAGSWVADELNDGFVPDSQLPWLMPAGAEELAQALVAARLWRRVRGGYKFHEWHKDGDGTKRNPTRAEVLADRDKKAEAGRKGGLVSGERRRAEKDWRGNENNWQGNEGPLADGSTGTLAEHDAGVNSGLNSEKGRSRRLAPAEANAEAPAIGLLEPPTRPDPTLRGGSSKSSTHVASGHSREPPPPKCQTHLDDPSPPPCGACGAARKALERWEVQQERDRAERERTMPKCPRHPEQRAHNCPLCRSEHLAGE